MSVHWHFWSEKWRSSWKLGTSLYSHWRRGNDSIVVWTTKGSLCLKKNWVVRRGGQSNLQNDYPNWEPFIPVHKKPLGYWSWHDCACTLFVQWLGKPFHLSDGRKSTAKLDAIAMLPRSQVSQIYHLWWDGTLASAVFSTGKWWLNYGNKWQVFFPLKPWSTEPTRIPQRVKWHGLLPPTVQQRLWQQMYSVAFVGICVCPFSFFNPHSQNVKWCFFKFYSECEHTPPGARQYWVRFTVKSVNMCLLGRAQTLDWWENGRGFNASSTAPWCQNYPPRQHPGKYDQKLKPWGKQNIYGTLEPSPNSFSEGGKYNLQDACAAERNRS